MGGKQRASFLVLGLAILAFATEEAYTAQFGGALPLWEPEWSPTLLLPGARMYPGVDLPKALCAIDLDGDGVRELLAGGDYVQVLSIRNGELYNHYLSIYVGIRKFVRPGGVSLEVDAMAAGDLDGDGFEDLVVATQGRELWVLRNHREWGFQWAPGSPYSLGANHVWLHDHDGDGKMDVFVGGYADVRFLKGDGRGGLAKPEPVSGVQGFLRGGEGGRYANTPGFFILTHQGLWFLPQGEFQAVLISGQGGKSLAVGDFNRDGISDVAIGGYLEVRIYLGQENGLAETTVLSVDHDVIWLGDGDINGDGFPDLVAGASSPGGFSVFYNLAGREFIGPSRYGTTVPVMRGLPADTPLGVVADFNGDGMDDVAVAASLGYVAFFLTRGAGRSLQLIPGSFLLGHGDMDGDGLPDLLSSTTEGGVAVLVNSGFGTFKAVRLLGPSGKDRHPFLARLGDVTGDGVDELVILEFSEESFVISNPGAPLEQWGHSKARATVWDLTKKEVLWSEPLGEEIRPLLILSDQTGDGIKDVVAAVGHKVIVLTHGDGKPLRMEINWGGPVGPLVALGDRTVAGLRVGEDVALLLLREGKPLETGLTLPLVPFDLIAADLDVDGNEDLISIGWMAWERKLAMGLAVLWGNGEGGFRPELFPLPGWPALALPYPYGGLVAADLNGDGKPELAAMRLPDREGNPGGIVVILWTETGPGELHLLPDCAGTNLFALDLDGDRRAELLTVHTGLPAWLCLTFWR